MILLCLLVCDLNRTPIVMAKHGGSCVHFSGISTCGRTSRETVSHTQYPPLPTLCKISLPIYVIVTNKLLQPLTTTWYDSLVLSFSLLKIWWRLIKHRSFLHASCARSCVVDGSAFSFAEGAVVCSTSLMASLIMKHETPARCRASKSAKQFSGLQKDYKFKFKYFIASYTWQGVYRGSCNKVSHTHTHENLTKHNILC